MNKEKIAKELNEWVQSEFGSDFLIKLNCDDLTLFWGDDFIAWFVDFDKHQLRFKSSNVGDVNVELIQKNVIEKFYLRGVELITKNESKYMIQVLPGFYGYLYKVSGDINNIVVDEIQGDDMDNNLFTNSEIEKLKKHHDVAVDWDKAIIKKVDADGR